MRLIARFLGFLFATGALIFVIGAGAAALAIWHFQQDLPDYTQLKNYEPPVMTRRARRRWLDPDRRICHASAASTCPRAPSRHSVTR